MVKTTDKKKTKWVKQAAELIIENIKNSNSVIDIMQEVETSDDATVVLQCIQAIQKIFLHMISKNIMSSKSLVNEDTEKYVDWIKNRYVDVRVKLLKLLNHSKFSIQENSLITLMKFVAAEGQNPLEKTVENCFPTSLFINVIKNITCGGSDNKRLIQLFQEFTAYDDVNFNLIKALHHTVHSQINKELPENYVPNTFALMSQIKLNDSQKSSDLENLCVNSDSSLNYYRNYDYSCKLFSALWMDFLKFKLSSEIYKKVLVMLESKVLPHLKKPLLLTDFLISSYDIGGSISLLALNGLFFLIQKYNLEYPDFYKKLYSLFQPSLFHTKYCARFFHLSNIFLMSTYLPVYLVAAFVKRLSRLALTAPVTKQFIIIPFIGNLMIRHPNLVVMVNRVGEISDLESDPYDPDEDPIKCNALSSSLWEIKDLQSHWHPDIACQARFIDKRLPDIEYDISETLEITYDELMEKGMYKMKSCPTTFMKPVNSMFMLELNEWML